MVDERPLPDVKLSLFEEQRLLDVLLHDKLEALDLFGFTFWVLLACHDFFGLCIDALAQREHIDPVVVPQNAF